MTNRYIINSTEFIEVMFPTTKLTQTDRTLLDELMGQSTIVTAPTSQLKIVEYHLLWRMLTHSDKDIVIVASDRHRRRTTTHQLSSILLDLDYRGIKTNCLLNVLGLSCVATNSSIRVIPPSMHMLRGTRIDTLLLYVDRDMSATLRDEVVEYVRVVGQKSGTNVIILREMI